MDTAVIRPDSGRGVKMTECHCFRPRCMVLCRNCGFMAQGRVRFSCPFHPRMVFLCDLTQCPDCKAYTSLLSEFDV